MWKIMRVILITLVVVIFSAFLNLFTEEVLEKQKKDIDFKSSDKIFRQNELIPKINSHLPQIYLETKGKQISKDRAIWCNISVVSSSEYMGDFVFASPATIKYRGNSSYYTFDKRQFRIEFYKEWEGKERDYDLMGMGKHSQWVLYGPFLDRSLVRNRLLYNLAREMMEWAPETCYCEVHLDGSYQGVYLVTEPVSNGEGRLRLSKFGLLSGDTAFIVKRERVGTERNVLHTYGEKMGFTLNELSLLYPLNSQVTKRQKNWVKEYISRFEEVLYGDEFASDAKGYGQFINVESFVDYYIINEFSMNSDAGALSTYCYRELGGKMYMAVWDFNNAFNNYMWDEKEVDRFFIVDNPWFDRLLQDKKFVGKVIQRYEQLRKTLLSEENMNKAIDNEVSYLGDAIERNFEVWGYTFDEKLLSDGKDGASRDPRSYQEAIAQLKETIQKRITFLDENMDTLYKNCIN